MKISLYSLYFVKEKCELNWVGDYSKYDEKGMNKSTRDRKI